MVFRIMASSLRACFCKIAPRFVQYFVNNPKSLSLYLFLLRSCVSGPHEGLHPLHLRYELPSRHPHLRDIHCCQAEVCPFQKDDVQSVAIFTYLCAVKRTLKRQCHEIFCFWFFSSISFPPAPEYPIRTVSNFFENSRRYSHLNIDHRCRWHRWQMRKIINQKIFNIFVETPLDSRVNTYIHFCFQVHFKVSATWY